MCCSLGKEFSLLNFIMHSLFSLILLLNPLFLSVTCLPPKHTYDLVLRGAPKQTDDMTISHWRPDQCFAYRNIGEDNSDYSVNRCTKFCKADLPKKGQTYKGAQVNTLFESHDDTSKVQLTLILSIV